MAFFRLKKIKGKEYAYRVENRWIGKSSRQKVAGYLGRAFRFDVQNKIEFADFCNMESPEKYIDENRNEKITSDLIEWEIARHQIPREKFNIDLENKKVRYNGKDVVLIMNNGFMCRLTLTNLLEFKTESEEQDGKRLARAFVEAGIHVPEEIFIGLFAKLYKAV